MDPHTDYRIILFEAPCGCRAYESREGGVVTWGVLPCAAHQEEMAPEIREYFEGGEGA